MKRSDSETVPVDLINLAKNAGLSHLINDITRPNIRGGTCIDLIMTNCIFVKEHGVPFDMVSDDYTVFAIHKNDRENKGVILENVWDYKNFNPIIFCQL